MLRPGKYHKLRLSRIWMCGRVEGAGSHELRGLPEGHPRVQEQALQVQLRPGKEPLYKPVPRIKEENVYSGTGVMPKIDLKNL